MQFLTIVCVLALGHVSAMALNPKAALLKMQLSSGEHPIAKVVAMIEDLKVKAEQQGQEEEVAYTKFSYWCKNSLKELNTAIAADKETIETLEDQIESKTKLIAQMETEIAELEKQLAASEVAAKKAKDIREEEEKDYTAANKDFESTIKAIDECIEALESSKSGLLAQKSVLKVISLAKFLVSDKERTVFTTFLQQNQAEDPKVYSFKSQKVIELLKKLKEKFETDQLEATKAETNSLNAYNLAKASRDQEDEATTKSKEEKESILSTAKEDLATFEEDLTSTKEDLSGNEGTLGSTTDTCTTRADEWATRQETRANEIKAMDVAIKILAKVGGVKAPPTLVQSKALSFIQVNHPLDPKAKAVNILVKEAKKLHSKSLARLAEKISKLGAGKGPFDEIIQMIQKMIFRLMAEQKDEDDHKNWCDMELEKSTESEKDKSEKLTALEDKINDAEAKVLKLAGEIEELALEASKITEYIQEETDLRKEAKAENAATVKDAKDAQDAISSAIAVLTDFYKSSGMVTSLMQKGHKEPVKLPEEPSTWDAGYTGVADPTNQPDGIISMLETILSDFNKMEADTVAQEEKDQQSYDKDMTEQAVEKSTKEKEGEMKTHEKARLVEKLKGYNVKKKHLVGELEAVQQYLKDLEPACVSGDSTYEDRKQARADEIDALRKAQTILEEAFKEKSFLQRKVDTHIQ